MEVWAWVYRFNFHESDYPTIRLIETNGSYFPGEYPKFKSAIEWVLENKLLLISFIPILLALLSLTSIALDYIRRPSK